MFNGYNTSLTISSICLCMNRHIYIVVSSYASSCCNTSELCPADRNHVYPVVMFMLFLAKYEFCSLWLVIKLIIEPFTESIAHDSR